MKPNKTEQVRTREGKRRMLESLRRNLGIVTPSLEQAQISRTTYYQWLKDDEEFKAETEIFQDVGLDFAETQMVALMRGTLGGTVEKRDAEGNIIQRESVFRRPPDGHMIRFFLKTKGKGRGYVEGFEVTNYNPDGPPKWFTGDEIEQ